MSQARRANGDKGQQLIDDQRTSGDTVAAFCRDRQIGQASFFAWRRRLSSRQASPPLRQASPPLRQASPPPPRFVEVMPAVAADAADASAIEVRLRGGRRLLVRHGFDRELLVATIGVLERIA
jgi:transposase-like protein